jgi:2'-5' RNA ligase
MAEPLDESRAREKRIRLFVAINLPTALKTTLAKVQQDLQSTTNPEMLKTIDSEQLHITLKFLGYVEPSLRPAIEKAIAQACAGCEHFHLRAERAGCFPGPRSPRVIWMGIEGDLSPLLALQKRLDAATAPWAEPEQRAFKPHLTLARVKEANRPDVKSIGRFLHKHQASDFGEWQVRTIDLMQSLLSRAGPTYACLYSAPLL